ncbi:hypothetical protein HDE_02390 [Halotydeus destructor]|nr:hypothetical protein HDE_02390 [Halotydeus destructor]
MMDVPSPVTAGESVEITCSYDLQGDRLYSVKYYKNGLEFYRYVPKDWPPAQYLAMPGIKVDVSRSDQNKVYLKHVDLNSAGRYRCEISAEAPSFRTAAAEKEMQIFVLPSDGPRIWSEKVDYKPSEMITVNCTSAKSKPPASLSWFINVEPMGPEHQAEYSTTLHADGLETSSLSIRFRLSEKSFKNGVMKLKCIASISEVYTISNEAQLVIYNVLDNQRRLEEEQRSTTGQLLTQNLSQVKSSASSQFQDQLSSLLTTVLRTYFAFLVLALP